MEAYKEFTGSKVQFHFEDLENEGYFVLNVSDLSQDADKDEVMAVGTALNSLVDGPLNHAVVTETHRIVL